MLVDRGSSRVSIMASTEGGMDIEEVAAETPEKDHVVTIDPVAGIQAFSCPQIAFSLGLKAIRVKGASRCVIGAYKAFMRTDASLLEINPLVVTGAARSSRSTPK